MKEGTQVWAAQATIEGIEVVSARVLGLGLETARVDLPVFGDIRPWLRSLHATRTAALEALAERLEQQAKEERAKASEFITRAERCLIQAGQARRMVGGGA